MSSQGSVRKDPKTGLWRFVIDIPRQNGKRQQVKRSGFRTKKEADQELAKIVADSARGTFHRPTNVTLGEFLIDEWLPAKALTLRPSTLTSYRQLVNCYAVPNLGGAKLAEVDGSMLNKLYADLARSGRTERIEKNGAGLSPKTIRNLHGLFAKAFSDAVRWNRIVRNPCDAADAPRYRSPEMSAWSTEELQQFLQSTTEHRWHAIFRLAATTGLRRGEILGLRWQDVDIEACTITVRRTQIRHGKIVETSTPKTERGNRTINVGAANIAALKQWKSAQATERLRMGSGWRDLGGHLVTLPDGTLPNPESFSNLFKKLVKQAGLTEIRLHDLRHTCATALLAAGVPVKVVSQRLGHADVGVTLKTYAHVMPGDDADAARRIEAALGF
ncbi:unannotated protein [freshwater metagenome]|uniref:Unannotated protein n=1 Tax=freshwater metagenome TaxID=449393 RepID=A0A6J6QJU0_9ZZZZ